MGVHNEDEGWLPEEERASHPSRFMPGNRFWEARSRHGRHPTFDGPEKLAEAVQDYFEWVEANPLYEARNANYEGEVTRFAMPKMRAMSIEGISLFVGVTRRTWLEWKTTRPDLLPVIEAAEDTMRMQKFEGASAGFLNASIIARDLGLAEAVKAEITGKGGGPIETRTLDPSKLSTQALAELMAARNDDPDE